MSKPRLQPNLSFELDQEEEPEYVDISSDDIIPTEQSPSGGASEGLSTSILTDLDGGEFDTTPPRHRSPYRLLEDSFLHDVSPPDFVSSPGTSGRSSSPRVRRPEQNHKRPAHSAPSPDLDMWSPKVFLLQDDSPEDLLCSSNIADDPHVPLLEGGAEISPTYWARRPHRSSRSPTILNTHSPNSIHEAAQRHVQNFYDKMGYKVSHVKRVQETVKWLPAYAHDDGFLSDELPPWDRPRGMLRAASTRHIDRTEQHTYAGQPTRHVTFLDDESPSYRHADSYGRDGPTPIHRYSPMTQAVYSPHARNSFDVSDPSLSFLSSSGNIHDVSPPWADSLDAVSPPQWMDSSEDSAEASRSRGRRQGSI